jgi:four helix bundle protein
MRKLLEKANTRGHADLVDQIRRCCNSVTANIREAYQEFSPGRKAQLYRIARASASEAAGHTDNLVDWGLVEEHETAEVRDRQDQIIALLITLARKQEERAKQEATAEG